jgi:hypothetical protein
MAKRVVDLMVSEPGHLFQIYQLEFKHRFDEVPYLTLSNNNKFAPYFRSWTSTT